MNSGAGGLAAAFIHEKHFNNNFPKLQGWWAHSKETRFNMDNSERDNLFFVTLVMMKSRSHRTLVIFAFKMSAMGGMQRLIEIKSCVQHGSLYLLKLIKVIA